MALPREHFDGEAEEFRHVHEVLVIGEDGRREPRPSRPVPNPVVEHGPTFPLAVEAGGVADSREQGSPEWIPLLVEIASNALREPALSARQRTQIYVIQMQPVGQGGKRLPKVLHGLSGGNVHEDER